MKVRYSTILLLLIFHTTFISIKYIPYYDYLRYVSLALVGIYLFSKIKYWANKAFLKDNALIITFLICISLSSYLSRDIHTFISGIIFALRMFETFVFLQLFRGKKEEYRVIKVFFRTLLFYIIINDFLLLIAPSLVDYYEGYYLLGDKFTISYLHMFLAVLYCVKNRLLQKSGTQKKIYEALLLFWAFIISLYCGCITGVIGTAIVFVLLNVPAIIKKLLSAPIVAVLVLIVSNFILFIYETILQNRYVIYLLEEVFHKDSGLNGRITIYENLFEVISKSPWFGFGYNRAYETLTSEISAVNAQNGLLNNVVNYGIVGTVVLIIVIYILIRKTSSNSEVFPVLAMFYMFFFLSCIEITLEYTFLAMLALLSMFMIKKDGRLKGNK